jgi:acyl-coenzyme A thioesterase PaaI-like protein
MAHDLSGAGSALRAAWKHLSPLPGGKRLFDLLLGRTNRYTGSVHPRFLDVRPGYVKVAMKDCRCVRNHVDSLHAIAMANLGEMSTGIGLMMGLPEGARAIITSLHIEYLRKGRGTLTAEGRCTPPSTVERQEVEATSEIRDEQGELVARVRTVWLVGPKGG